MYYKRHIFPAEVVSVELGEVILEEISPNWDLRSHEVEYRCQVELADGSTVPVYLLVEAIHGPEGIKLMYFEFLPEVDGVDQAIWEVEPDWAREEVWRRYQDLGGKLSLEERQLVRQYVVSCFDLSQPEKEVEFLLEYAQMLHQNRPPDGKVVRAADMGARAFSYYKEGLVNQEFWDRMVARFHDSIWSQMVGCHSRAKEKIRAEEPATSYMAMLYSHIQVGQIMKEREWGAPRQLAWSGYPNFAKIS